MIFDLHSDIWTDVLTRQLKGETDILNRYHYGNFMKSNTRGNIFVIWPDPPYDNKPLIRTKLIIDAIEREIRYADNHFAIVHNYPEFISALEKDKIGIFLGLEGLSSIGKKIDMIDAYYRFGARHASLTWNEGNDLATGVAGDSSRGLTDSGKEAYKRISSLGMIFDVSHLNEKSFWDVVKIADKPIIASHSNCRSICNVPRNLTDDQLRAIGESGGLVGINSFNQFVHKGKELQNVEILVDHIVHMAEIMGIDHIAFGFDFCDYLDDSIVGSFSSQETAYTTGLEDSSKSQNIIEEMRKRGFSRDEIEKVSSGNILEIIRKILK